MGVEFYKILVALGPYIRTESHRMLGYSRFNDFIQSYKPEQGFASHSEAERSVLNFLSKHLPAADGEYLRTGKYKIVYLDYNWTLNAQKPKKE